MASSRLPEQGAGQTRKSDMRPAGKTMLGTPEPGN
jgi:hypothetical protein